MKPELIHYALRNRAALHHAVLRLVEILRVPVGSTAYFDHLPDALAQDLRRVHVDDDRGLGRVDPGLAEAVHAHRHDCGEEDREDHPLPLEQDAPIGAQVDLLVFGGRWLRRCGVH